MTAANANMDSTASSEALREAARREKEVLGRLRKALKDKSLVIIIGAGVTLSATSDPLWKPLPRLTWTGLVRNGLDYLVNGGYVEASNHRTRQAYNSLGHDDPDSLLDAANIMASQMRRNGQLPTWLESVFGSLYSEVRHPAILEVLQALHKKGATLLTTNYDDILEKACNLTHIGRSKLDEILKFKRGDLDGIFHVHGSYHDPNEVVLDATDYYQVTHSDEVQNLLKTFLELKTILFVGCGSGLEDPNFSALLKWASERQENIPNRHCLLVRDGDGLNHHMLVRLKYGPKYHDLAPYLHGLLDEPVPQAMVPRVSAVPAGESFENLKNAFSISAISRYPDHLDLFLCASDGLVYTAWWSKRHKWSSKCSGWECLGAPISKFPPRANVSALAHIPDQIDLYACANDGKAYYTTWSKASGWFSRWGCLDGSFPPGASITAVARNPKHCDLFGCGTDGAVWTRSCSWSDDDNIGDYGEWVSLGGRWLTGSNVAVVSRKPDHLDVFVCGGNGSIYTKWLSRRSGWWNKWENLGGLFPPNATVSAIARKAGQLDLFACGRDRYVYTSWWTEGSGHGWSGKNKSWKCLGGDFSPGTNISALGRQSEIDLFVSGTDGHVYTCWYNKDGWLQHWKDLDGSFADRTVIASVARKPEHLDVFACNDKCQVYTAWWNNEDSHGAKWSNLDAGWYALGQLHFPDTTAEI